MLLARVVEERAEPLAVGLGCVSATPSSSSLRVEPALAITRRASLSSGRSRASRSTPRALATASRTETRGHGRREVDRLPLVGDRRRRRTARSRAVANSSSVSVISVAVGRVGLVELEHRELGVVLARQPLVAEVAADLVDAIEAADHQPLEVQLGRDPQVERRGRARCGACRNGLRRRAAQRSPCIIGVSTSRKSRSSRKRADEPDDARARAEDLRATVGVRDQIDVALRGSAARRP